MTHLERAKAWWSRRSIGAGMTSETVPDSLAAEFAAVAKEARESCHACGGPVTYNVTLCPLCRKDFEAWLDREAPREGSQEAPGSLRLEDRAGRAVVAKVWDNPASTANQEGA